MKALAAALSVLVVAGYLAPPVLAHHVGSYTARDNEVSTNFKQIKFSLQARKFDVALRLFESGALRKEMQARAARLPAGLETATRAALRSHDTKAAELDLALFVAALARDLALEADRKLADAAAAAEARVAAGAKFLEAIWRYYNLVDFAITERDSRTAVGIRLAFEEADRFTKSNGRTGPAPDPTKMRAPLQRVAQLLGDFIQSAPTSSVAPTSGSAPAPPAAPTRRNS
jgi:hypothetical protein